MVEWEEGPDDADLDDTTKSAQRAFLSKSRV